MAGVHVGTNLVRLTFVSKSHINHPGIPLVVMMALQSLIF